MKTIRYNTFETNSSSTHAYTLCRRKTNKDACPFPDPANIEIAAGSGLYEDMDIPNRFSFALNYAACLEDLDKIAMIQTAILNRWPNAKVSLVKTKYDYSARGYTKVNLLESVGDKIDPMSNAANDAITDTFYAWTRDEDGVNSEAFIATMEKVFSSQGELEEFLFGTAYYISSHEYYDG